jgi:ubiquinone/menaquinone biosynthesis C-methylase UbiE
MSTREYIFADQDHRAEQERLDRQAGLLDPLTERLFGDAGLQPGMRVLDLGSGGGHVAQLAARIVGPEGSVMGVEQDPEAAASAQQRLRALGLENVEIVAGDAQTLDGVEGGFDAVVGRVILMYVSDPVEAIRQAARRLRPGGILVMHEGDMTYDWTAPPSPLWQQVQGWFLQTLERAGVEPRMGLRLYETYVRAGLPGPQLALAAMTVGGPEAFAWGWANVVKAVVPLMERLGVTTAAEVDGDTLADRLLAEVEARDGIVIGPPMVGAWVTVG